MWLGLVFGGGRVRRGGVEPDVYVFPFYSILPSKFEI